MRKWLEGACGQGAVSSRIRTVAKTALDMAFPLRCLECRRLFHHAPDSRGPELSRVEHHTFESLVDHYLCPSCRRPYVSIESPMCSRCGHPFVSKHTKDHLCADCHSQSMPFHMARSAGSYEGALRTLIHHLKFQGCVQLAGPLGRLLWWSFLTHWISDQVDLIVPVPLHPKRMRQRGFNQAYQLVRQWTTYAHSHGVLMDAPIRLNVLRRQRPTLPQTGLDRRQREVNVADAFVLDQKDVVSGRRILVVDDVFTTGATLKACAKLLMKAGAARVDVLTLARAI